MRGKVLFCIPADVRERFFVSVALRMPDKTPVRGGETAHWRFCGKMDKRHAADTNRRMSKRTIAIYNQKGGVGKTTTAVNLAAALGAAGKRVLLIDLDAQKNASMGFGRAIPDAALSVHDFIFDGVAFKDVVIKDAARGVDLLPSNSKLDAADSVLAGRGITAGVALKQAMQGIPDHYDYVIIDNSPKKSLLGANALIASDWVLIPARSDIYSVAALEAVKTTLNEIDTIGANPGLAVLGVILTQIRPREKVSRAVVDAVKESWGDLVFDAKTEMRTEVDKACFAGAPIATLRPDSSVGSAYHDLATEVIERTTLENQNRKVA